MRPSLRITRPHRGAAIIYGIVVMSVLLALCSIAVDYGYAQLVRTELQAAADGAARAAASGISTDLAEAKKRARDLGAMNRAAGEPITFTDGDFRFGRWNESTNQIDTSGTPIDAVEITARRTVSLFLRSMFGKGSIDISARATARGGSSTGHAIVGLESITMSGNAAVDSFDSSMGPYSAVTRRTNADIGTNGDLTLSGNVKIHGDASYKGRITTSGGAGVVSPGQATKITSTLSFPAPRLPETYSNQGDLNGSGNNSLTLTSGNYLFKSFNASGNFHLIIAGQVNIYVTDGFSLSGNMTVVGNKPGNFRVHMLGEGNVNLSGDSTLYADVYAPRSEVSISGKGDLYGRFVGRTVSASGNGNIHFDESLAANGTGGIALVK